MQSTADRGIVNVSADQAIDLVRSNRSRSPSLVMTRSARSALLFARPLGSLARLETSRMIPAHAGGRPARSALGARRVDEHDEVAQIVPARFEQDRGIEHDDARARRRRVGPASIAATNRWRIRG